MLIHHDKNDQNLTWYIRANIWSFGLIRGSRRIRDRYGLDKDLLDLENFEGISIATPAMFLAKLG